LLLVYFEQEVLKKALYSMIIRPFFEFEFPAVVEIDQEFLLRKKNKEAFNTQYQGFRGTVHPKR